MRPKRHYLSDLIAEEGPDHPRFPTKLKCMIYYCRKGLREYTVQKGMVAEISRSGCKILCPVSEAVDNHVYLVIEGFPAKFPSAVARRAEGEIEVRFYEEIPAEVIARLTARRF